uniref:F-box/LRR-repeat protein 15/At3g58940/PEG3-like LRR domain-containing protein n=1 Tax=Oryza punctata TaxID=4537 RepID=A0A0E0LH26_ORYPU
MLVFADANFGALEALADVELGEEIPNSMEHGDGELTTNREKPYVAGGGDGGEDRLSALPDDILVQMLLRVGAGGAARTSVLSRRWRHLWYLLPELNFGPQADAHSIRTALAAHESPSLHRLAVRATDAGPRRMAEWLPVAARRLSGDLFLVNRTERIEQGTFLELPCFGSATSLSLELGFVGLAVPLSGVFAQLTSLSICGVHFHGPCELGDAVSSPQFPCLKKLTVLSAHRLSNFNIHSKSLLQIVLKGIELQQLNIVAPALEFLDVKCHFSDGSAQTQSQPVANISAPKLEILGWSTTDLLDPSSVQFGKMSNLQWLGTEYFYVYGEEGCNHGCLRLLQHFQFDAIPSLSILLAYFPIINGHGYLMEDMTVLPNIMFLNLIFFPSGHCMVCGSDCVCDLPQNWRSEELMLNSLREVRITNLRGTENEFAVVKRLFSWAAALKQMTINFHSSITMSTARELCEMLQSFSRPEISMKFYIDQGSHKVVYVPED